ncbi:beta-N-acetylglucosaminidase, partial [Streptomyces sp. NPDC003483]
MTSRTGCPAPELAGPRERAAPLRTPPHDASPRRSAADRPAKPRRGFMLDIARKHFTASWIEDRVREL